MPLSVAACCTAAESAASPDPTERGPHRQGPPGFTELHGHWHGPASWGTVFVMTDRNTVTTFREERPCEPGRPACLVPAGAVRKMQAARPEQRSQAVNLHTAVDGDTHRAQNHGQRTRPRLATGMKRAHDLLPGKPDVAVYRTSMQDNEGSGGNARAWSAPDRGLPACLPVITLPGFPRPSDEPACLALPIGSHPAPDPGSLAAALIPPARTAPGPFFPDRRRQPCPRTESATPGGRLTDVLRKERHAGWQARAGILY